MFLHVSKIFTSSYFGDENKEQGSRTVVVRPTILHGACMLHLGPIIAATRKVASEKSE